MGLTACTEPQCLYKGDLYLCPFLHSTTHVQFLVFLRFDYTTELLRHWWPCSVNYWLPYCLTVRLTTERQSYQHNLLIYLQQFRSNYLITTRSHSLTGASPVSLQPCILSRSRCLPRILRVGSFLIKAGSETLSVYLEGIRLGSRVYIGCTEWGFCLCSAPAGRWRDGIFQQGLPASSQSYACLPNVIS